MIHALFVAFIACIPLGCTVYVGPAGFAVVAFGSAYTHRESFADPPTAPPKGETEASGGLESWTTVALRTFGTVDVEATVDMNSERIALTGKGMSPIMGAVIGDDVAEKIGQIVACSLQPAQPACIGIGGASGSPAATAASYLEAFRELRGSPESAEVDESDSTEPPPPTE